MGPSWSEKAAKGQPSAASDHMEVDIRVLSPREEIVVRSGIHRLWDVPPPHCASCLTTPLVSDKERLRRRWGRM